MTSNDNPIPINRHPLGAPPVAGRAGEVASFPRVDDLSFLRSLPSANVPMSSPPTTTASSSGDRTMEPSRI
jgi:hypothetical protein